MSSGPLTFTDLMTLWESVVAPTYSVPLLDNPDSGIELIQQAAFQFARVSYAIDVTTQAMFLLPWSGQSNEPAPLGAKARVHLTFTRDLQRNQVVTFIPLQIQASHITQDATTDGPETVETGRFYTDVDTSLTFAGGDVGPFDLLFEAEREGYGYNNPLPNTIVRLHQIGAGFHNVAARLDVTGNDMVVTCTPAPDVFVPEHVGQYFSVESGIQKGQIRRVALYIPAPLPPDPLADVIGGQIKLVPTLIGRVTVLSGTFLVDEIVTQIDMAAVPATDPDIVRARGTFRRLKDSLMVIDVIDGAFLAGAPPGPYLTRRIYGQSSLAVAEFVATSPIEQPPLLTADASMAWRILPWEELGIHVTNAASPSGGKLSLLEEIGYGRDLPRTAGENAELYRRRIAAPADVVSPNAIRRTCNRLLESLGLSITLHEIGLPSFRGMFYDVEASFSQFDAAFAFFYDNDSVYIAIPEV